MNFYSWNLNGICRWLELVIMVHFGGYSDSQDWIWIFQVVADR